MSEYRLQHLRPGQIVQRLAQLPVVLVPIGPLESHRPRMPYGTDALNATEMADQLCSRVGGLLWPTSSGAPSANAGPTSCTAWVSG